MQGTVDMFASQILSPYNNMLWCHRNVITGKLMKSYKMARIYVINIVVVGLMCEYAGKAVRLRDVALLIPERKGDVYRWQKKLIAQGFILIDHYQVKLYNPAMYICLSESGMRLYNEFKGLLQQEADRYSINYKRFLERCEKGKF